MDLKRQVLLIVADGRAKWVVGAGTGKVAWQVDGITSIQLRLHVPAKVPAERLPGLLAVASRCTLHNTLDSPPDVEIALDEPARPEAFAS